MKNLLTFILTLVVTCFYAQGEFIKRKDLLPNDYSKRILRMDKLFSSAVDDDESVKKIIYNKLNKRFYTSIDSVDKGIIVAYGGPYGKPYLTNSDKLVNRIFFVDTCLMDYKKDYDILKLRDTLTNEIIWYKQDRKVNSSLFSIYYPNEEMMSDVNLKLHKFKKTNRTSQTLNFVGGVLSVIGTGILMKNPTSKASKPFYVLSGASFILGYGFYLKSYDYLSID
jgi:hypothetical protein